MWRLRLIESASEELVLSTFTFKPDDTGKKVMAALMAAAQRGVHIRILVDGGNGYRMMKRNPFFRALASFENVEIRLYNVSGFFSLYRINYRMHDKYMISDHRAFLVGGRNINDTSLGSGIHYNNRDRDILIYDEFASYGSSVYSLHAYFNRIWNLKRVSHLTFSKRFSQVQNSLKDLETIYRESGLKHMDYLKSKLFASVSFPAESITTMTNPVRASMKHPFLWDCLSSVVKGRKNILIQTPYIICDKAMYLSLSELSAHTSLKVLTNAPFSCANIWGCSDYLNEKPSLLKNNIPVYEYSGDCCMHTTPEGSDTYGKGFLQKLPRRICKVSMACSFDMESFRIKHHSSTS